MCRCVVVARSIKKYSAKRPGAAAFLGVSVCVVSVSVCSLLVVVGGVVQWLRVVYMWLFFLLRIVCNDNLFGCVCKGVRLWMCCIYAVLFCFCFLFLFLSTLREAHNTREVH